MSTRKRRVRYLVVPCDGFADGTAPPLVELSCVFDFAESLPRDLENGFLILFNNELSAMVSASTFDLGLFADKLCGDVDAGARLLQRMRIGIAGPGANRNPRKIAAQPL